MRYHLLIQSADHVRHFEFLKDIIQKNHEVAQVLFYDQGVLSLKDLAFTAKWSTLISESGRLKICKTEFEKNKDFLLPKGFVLSGLIDFFSEHWKDKGILLQL